MIQSEVGQPRGILNPQTGEKKFQLSQHQPPPDLDFFIAHYWIIYWNLEEPYRSETLPHPSVHLAIEQGRSEIVGVVTGRFARLIEGKGHVFGIKFRPGAFYPFVRTPISAFTNKTCSLHEVFGMAGPAFEAALLAVDDKSEMIELANNFIRERLPEHDANVALIHEITDYIVSNREITKVDDLASRFALTKRTLQRLFHQYVGVSPKWMIKRYRLHEAAEQLNIGEAVNWPELALDLGYFDQAHFIKDFKTIVGWTPGEYTRRIGAMINVPILPVG
jgi:AraC-like DNA-binding protein